MRIGVPKEIKDHEYRVGLTPGSVQTLVAAGHTVFVENNAGAEIGFSNEKYHLAGAEIIPTASALFASSKLIVKVKEPQPEECQYLKPDHILFAFLHLAPDQLQAELLMQSGCTAIAYETVTDEHHSLPLLKPMSEVAGRLSIQMGAHWLEKSQGGPGKLLGGIPGVAPAKVVILGGGAAGTQALQMALGMGASVTVMDNSLKRLRELEVLFSGKVVTYYASDENIKTSIIDADLVVGAILVPGSAAPKLITRDMLSTMQKGSVLVDISIDQGGCFETSHPTTQSNPTYVVDGILHYCVTNIPGAAAPLTATLALNNATLPFVRLLADKGYRTACLENPYLRQGLNVCNGQITYRAVAESLHQPYIEAEVVLNAVDPQGFTSNPSVKHL